MQRILITGAAGEIGTVLRAGLAGRYSLRLADLRACSDLRPGEEDCVTDVTDPDAAIAAARGMDCVVHLAGVPREGPWDRILPINNASRRLVPSLHDDRYKVRYEEFEGPHTVPENIAEQAFRWLVG